MRNMKKLGAFVAAAMLAVMSLTAVAAPSPKAEVSAVTDKNGNPVKDVKYASVSPDVEKKLEDSVAALVGDTFKDLKVSFLQDVTVPEGTAFPLTIKFNVAGVKADSKVAVLHFDETKGVWEKLEGKAGAGTVEATFTSLSPVAVVVDASTLSTEDGKTSPGTGEGYMTTVIAMVVVVAAAGAYTLKRKESAR